MTAARLIRWAGLAAALAGVLFVIIQPIHPPDTLASVTTATWAIVHYATLAMTVLFLVGIAGIYARQVEETGWLGLSGFLLLGLGLLITAAFVFVEAFISPVLAADHPEVVEGFLSLVDGSATVTDLGALPALWSASGVLFPLGCLVLGVATLRAGILPRWASAVFAFGLPVVLVVVSLLPFDLHRLGAIPIGVGLAGLGRALWSAGHSSSSNRTTGSALPGQPRSVA